MAKMKHPNQNREARQAFNPFNPMNAKFHDGVLPVPNSLGNFTYVKSSSEFAFNSGTGTDTDFLQSVY